MIPTWTKFEIFSPMLVRMMARVRNKPIPLMQIVDRSGLVPPMVESISQSDTWDCITLPEAQAFLTGCNCDFTEWTACHRMFEYLKSKPTFIHLRTSPDWESYWKPMMARWRNAYGPVPAKTVYPPLRGVLMRLPYTKRVSYE